MQSLAKYRDLNRHIVPLDLQDINKCMSILLHERLKGIHWRVAIVVVLSIETVFEEVASRTLAPGNFWSEL